MLVYLNAYSLSTSRLTYTKYYLKLKSLFITFHPSVGSVCVRGVGGGLWSAAVLSFNLNLFQYTRLMRNNWLCLGSVRFSLLYLMSTLSDRLVVFFFLIINHESVRRNKTNNKNNQKSNELINFITNVWYN